MRITVTKLALLALLVAPAFSQTLINIDTQTKGSRLPSWGVDSGAANAYAITTIGPLAPSLRTGSRFMFIATHANTGASTLAVDGGSAIAIKKAVSTALSSGDIPLNGVVEVTYDGTNFQYTNAALGGLPTGSAGGDLSGTYPNPTVAQVSGGAVPASAAVAGTNSSKQIIAATAHQMTLPLACPDSSGSGSAQSCSTTPTFTPASGDWILYTTTTANSGDVTVNVNSSSAAHVRKWLGSSTLAAGDLVANTPMLLVYDGTYWEIPTIGNAPSGGGGSWPTFTCANDGTTGTILNRFAKWNASANTCQVVGSGDSVSGTFIVGITTGGAGTTGNATIQWTGDASLTFDNGITQNDVCIPSTTANGEGHDPGSHNPPNQISAGWAGYCRIKSATNASAGTYTVTMNFFGSTGNGGAQIFTIPMYAIGSPVPVPSSLVQSAQYGTTTAYHDLCQDNLNGQSLCLHWNSGSGGYYSLDVSNTFYPLHLDQGLATAVMPCNDTLCVDRGFINNVTITTNDTLNTGGDGETLQTGQFWVSRICQDATGGHTVAWNSKFRNPPTVATTASTGIVAEFFAVDSTHVYTIGSTTVSTCP